MTGRDFFRIFFGEIWAAKWWIVIGVSAALITMYGVKP